MSEEFKFLNFSRSLRLFESHQQIMVRIITIVVFITTVTILINNRIILINIVIIVIWNLTMSNI